MAHQFSNKIISSSQLKGEREKSGQIYYLLFIIYYFFTVLGLRCCVQAFFSCGKQGATLLCSAQASHCGGFSCCGAWALGKWSSVVAACGLSSCGTWVLQRVGFCSCGAWAQ